MEERFRFIEEWKQEEWSFAGLCRRFKVSRKTGYKWLERYQEDGLDGLKDRSSAPHEHPNQVPEEIEQAIIVARGKHPH